MVVLDEKARKIKESFEFRQQFRASKKKEGYRSGQFKQILLLQDIFHDLNNFMKTRIP
jgi:hypothetical protein